MATYTVNINTSGAPTTRKLTMSSGQTVQWYNEGSKTVTISFTGNWPFTSNVTTISVAGTSSSSTYTAKSALEQDPYDVQRDGTTTGTGEIDLSTADPLQPMP